MLSSSRRLRQRSSAQPGKGLYHTETLVKSGLDDVEEAHAGPIQGFLYQGSSDLELGNHVEVDAPEWLAGDDPVVVANRDCSKARDGSGGIDSLCMPNYDCQAMMDWKPIKDYYESQPATANGLQRAGAWFPSEPGGTSVAAVLEATVGIVRHS